MIHLLYLRKSLHICDTYFDGKIGKKKNEIKNQVHRWSLYHMTGSAWMYFVSHSNSTFSFTNQFFSSVSILWPRSMPSITIGIRIELLRCMAHRHWAYRYRWRWLMIINRYPTYEKSIKLIFYLCWFKGIVKICGNNLLYQNVSLKFGYIEWTASKSHWNVSENTWQLE